MKSKIRLVILIILILIVAGFFYFKYYYHRVIPTGQATLSWAAGTDNTIKGYKIYYDTSRRNSDCPPGGYAKNLDAGQANKYTLKNLEAGKTYYFSVTSYNSSGKESCFSQEMSKKITISLGEKIKDFLGFGGK